MSPICHQWDNYLLWTPALLKEAGWYPKVYGEILVVDIWSISSSMAL